MTTPKTKRSERKQAGKKKKGVLREWADSIVFAVVAATIIRWLFIEAYMIPTSSMENSLLVGDYLFVSKMHYGARTPATPLQVPLTFQKIWGTNIQSYLDWVQLPMYRLPGFSDVERYDPIVFNYPAEGTGAYSNDGFGSANEIPADMRTYYIKRCIGLPGDKLEIKKQQVYIDGKAIENPKGIQSSYKIVATQQLNPERILQPNNIFERDLRNWDNKGSKYYIEAHPNGNKYIYEAQAGKEAVEKLRKMDFIESVEPIIKKEARSGSFVNQNMQDTSLNWSTDFFGPLTIPKRGMTIQLTPDNFKMYKSAIKFYEENENVTETAEAKLLIDGKPISEYTFKKDYYFMMGDNRHASADSRAWGFVPEDYIVGKALFVWWSIEPDKSWSDFTEKVRWNKIFSLID